MSVENWSKLKESWFFFKFSALYISYYLTAYFALIGWHSLGILFANLSKTTCRETILKKLLILLKMLVIRRMWTAPSRAREISENSYKNFIVRAIAETEGCGRIPYWRRWPCYCPGVYVLSTVQRQWKLKDHVTVKTGVMAAENSDLPSQE